MRLSKFLPSFIRRWLKRGERQSRILRRLESELQAAKLLAAETLVRQVRSGPPLLRLADAEFQVFSQFGDDGIIQYLVHRLGVEPRTFVEFGVENYLESNTRFLLLHDNWTGMVLDGSQENVASIRQDEIYWRRDLTAVRAFIDPDNINPLLSDHGFVGELGLLSIDIDGNDYWVWERIDVVHPVIVIVEYNSVFGCKRPVSVPLDPTFQRTRAHTSNLYWGCSLPALCSLGRRKGYAFVGCNSHGNNAYFVRQDWLDASSCLQPLTAEAGYVESKFRESRDAKGRLTFLSGEHRRAAIADLLVTDVETGETLSVRQAA